MTADDPVPGSGWRATLVSVALGLALLAGRALAPGPVPALAWAALAAAPLGAWVGARRLVPLLALPAAWLLLEPGPRAGGALVALIGLALLGAGLTSLAIRRAPGARATVAGSLLLAGAVLTALPILAGPGSGPGWDPVLVAGLLDLSPVTLVVEAAGHDWLRDPAIYDRAGGDAIGPGLRAPLGPLAAGVPALVGCGALGASRALDRS